MPAYTAAAVGAAEPLSPAVAAAADGSHPAAAAAPDGSSGVAVQAGTEAGELYYATLPLGVVNPTVIEYGTSSSGSGGGSSSSSVTAGRQRYLCYFIHRHLEFRLPEIEALAAAAISRGGSSSSGNGSRSSASGSSSSGPPVVWEKPFGTRLDSPLWYAHLPSDDVARQVASKSMLAKAFLDVWAEADSLEGLRQALTQYSPEAKAKWGGEEQSFKFVVDTWGCTYTPRQQVELIEGLDECTAFKGPIDLKAPHNKWWVIVVNSNGKGLPPLPDRYYFGREVGAGDRSVISAYDLRQRRYLGPTSMDTEMAFIMCNMAQVGKNSLMLDPFVGTGSILVPAAHRGALTLGTDIDIRVIKIGKKDKAGRPVNIWTNFEDYRLRAPLGLLRCDLHTFPFRDNLEEMLDAIVCDPPYGVRAGGKKSVFKDREIRDHSTYVPSTDPYTVAECLHDLLEFAARVLTLGGRVVYFLPACPGYYFEEEIPRHPALEMVSNCEQMLTTRYSRRLITMQKVRRYDADEEAAHNEARGLPVMSIDSMHEHIFKTQGELAAESGLSMDQHRQAQKARIPVNRGKNI